MSKYILIRRVGLRRMQTFLSSASIAAIVLGGGQFFAVTQVYAQSQAELEAGYPGGMTLDQISTPAVAAASASGSDKAITADTAMSEDIFLDAIVNGEKKDSVLTVRQKNNGDFIAREDDLRAVGILPVRKARVAKGWIDLAALPKITYYYNAQQRVIEFVATDESALAPNEYSLNPWVEKARRGSDDEEGAPRSDLSAIINYNIYADTGDGGSNDLWNFQGVSTNLEGRISGKFGTFNHSQLLNYSHGGSDKYRSTRLDSFWSYSDPESLVTYRVGDLVTRSLSWSRSVRLGGFQYRRNFGLRPDLVTMPLPSFNGSAAVPSAVDVYVNNAKRATENVPVGPFSLTDMPVISGANSARLVVRDAQGRETVTEMAFYSSTDLLAKGLLDFSVEGGFPRQYFGTRSGDYDGKFMASGTARYGLTDRVTLEGHAEAGSNFFNGGMGTTFTLWDVGQISLAGSASTYKGRSGQQFAAGLQLQRWGLTFNARTQRSYSNYNDIASVADDRMRHDRLTNGIDSSSFDEKLSGIYSSTNSYGSARPAKAINQVSLSLPTKIDPLSLTFSYTEVDNWDIDDSRYVSVSATRSFGKRVYGYANAFQDLHNSNTYGVFAGFTVTLDDKHTASMDVQNDRDGSSVSAQLRRQLGSGIGDYGWTLRDMEGHNKQRGAQGSYRSNVALVSGSVEQFDDMFRGTAEAQGAIVFADRSVMLSNYIYDSFAVVDAGAPNVSVNYQNMYYGKTGRNGKLIIPNLTSYQPGRISLDMDTLPADALVENTDAVVVPGQQAGVVESFGVRSVGDYAYLSIRDEAGNPIERGSYATIVGTDIGFDIAYDGLGVLTTKGVSMPIRLKVERPGGRVCEGAVNAISKQGFSSGAQTVTCMPVTTSAKARN